MEVLMTMFIINGKSTKILDSLIMKSSLHYASNQGPLTMKSSLHYASNQGPLEVMSGMP